MEGAKVEEKDGKDKAQAAVRDATKEFFLQAAKCEEKNYASAGLGKDFRYSGPRIVGSSLAVDDAVIHMAFFRMTETEKAGNMAGPSRRRSFIV